jgi:hypothetical protein
MNLRTRSDVESGGRDLSRSWDVEHKLYFMRNIMLCDNTGINKSCCCVKSFFVCLDTVGKIVIKCTKYLITCWSMRISAQPNAAEIKIG